MHNLINVYYCGQVNDHKAKKVTERQVTPSTQKQRAPLLPNQRGSRRRQRLRHRRRSPKNLKQWLLRRQPRRRNLLLVMVRRQCRLMTSPRRSQCRSQSTATWFRRRRLRVPPRLRLSARQRAAHDSYYYKGGSAILENCLLTHCTARQTTLLSLSLSLANQRAASLPQCSRWLLLWH